LFDGIAGGDRFAVKKPAAGHLLGLIAELGGEVGNAAMIGDNENDAACMPFVLMRYGYVQTDPETLGAVTILDRFGGLPQTLERLGLGP
jgi:phosphoglycolate phosphatase